MKGFLGFVGLAVIAYYIFPPDFFRALLPAPQTHMRISLEALPPKTGRSCMMRVLTPCRAAAMAAHIPAIPPPITQN